MRNPAVAAQDPAYRGDAYIGPGSYDPDAIILPEDIQHIRAIGAIAYPQPGLYRSIQSAVTAARENPQLTLHEGVYLLPHLQLEHRGKHRAND